MAEKQFFVTKEGLKDLEKERDYLIMVRRKEVSEKIKVALSFGDLSENSEYDEAKKNAVVIDESELGNETVHIGSTVDVSVTSPNGKQSERTLRIVGSNEADPRNGKISDESAVGQALIGAVVNQTVVVEAPAGMATYVVNAIN